MGGFLVNSSGTSNRVTRGLECAIRNRESIHDLGHPLSEGFKWGVGSVGRWICKFGAPHFCPQFAGKAYLKGFGEILR